MIALDILGPYTLYGEENDFFQCEEAKHSGIYLWTIPYSTGYLTYWVGETGRAFSRRISEHVQEYLSGVYRVYDEDSFLLGQRNLIWEGMWMKGTKDNMGIYLQRYHELAPKIHRYLGTFRIFLLPFDGNTRLRQRIEAKLAETLKKNQQAVADGFFDEAVTYRASFWEGEESFEFRIKSLVTILGLEDTLSV